MGTPILGSFNRLLDLIEALDEIDDQLIICTPDGEECTCESPALLRNPGDFKPGDPKGVRHQYLLEVGIAKGVLRAWAYARKNQVPSLAEKCRAIIYYAKFDAYLPLGE